MESKAARAKVRVVIDDEFSSLIPPLSQDERRQLEANIIDAGCARDPLVVWATENGDCVLLDGHNRYEICARHLLPYEVNELTFECREDAADWIDRNQLGRRNLDPRQMSLLRGRRYNRTKREDGGHGDQKSGGQNVRPNAAESLATEHGVNEKTIRRDGEFAEAVESLGIEREVVTGQIEATKQEIVAVAKSLPKCATPEQVKHAVEQVKKPHVANNSGEVEWYTPPQFIVAAREVMGEIDLDPASSSVAQNTVQAKRFYTKDDDGLSVEWRGRVWLNPPYSSELLPKFVDKLCESIDCGKVSKAVVLVNNATETSWFQKLAASALMVCFPKSRIKFHDATGKPANTPLQGQAILFFGGDGTQFVEVFRQFGFVAEVRYVREVV